MQRVGLLGCPLFAQRVSPRYLRRFGAQMQALTGSELADLPFWRGRLPANGRHQGLRLRGDRLSVPDRLRIHGTAQRFAFGHAGQRAQVLLVQVRPPDMIPTGEAE